jgi:hypothetical protein
MTASYMLTYIAQYAPSTQPGDTARQLAQRCLVSNGVLATSVSGCGNQGDSCCSCVFAAFGYAIRGQWDQCAAKLGHGHGGPP